MHYKIFETEEFIKDLRHDFSGHREKIRNKLHQMVYPQLQMQPFYGMHIKKLMQQKPETWRYRIGDYRFFYTIDAKEKIVYMLCIDHRKDAY